MKFETSNIFPEFRMAYRCGELGFLTSHVGRVLLCIAHDPGARLRDLAANLGRTHRMLAGVSTGNCRYGW